MKLQNKFIPWIALGVSIFATVLLWNTMYNLEMQKNQLEFEIITNKIQHSVEDKVMQYNTLINGAKGFFGASQLVEPGEWAEFVNVQNIKEKFPGIQGFGFIKHVENEEEIANLNQFMANHEIDYKIWPEGKRDEYYPVMYLEPQDNRNKRVIGYDVYSEPTRRQAVETARDNNVNTITGKIILVQENEQDTQNGFLMMQPVYKTGKSTETEKERRNNIDGFVYVPFRMNDFMTATLDPEITENINVKIYDGAEKPQNLFFSNEDISSKFGDNVIIRKTVMEFGQREWTFVFCGFVPINPADNLVSTIIIIAGSVVSVLLFFVFYIINKNSLLIEERSKTEKFTIIGELSARLTHDLRNPLSVIKSSIELLKIKLENNSDEKTSKYIQMIEKSVAMMNNQIEDTLNYARSKQPKTVKESILEIIKTSVTNAIHGNNIKIILPQNDVIIQCEKDQITVVFNNILSNSIQAIGDKDGVITISMEDKKDHAIINIEDSGPGIPDDILLKIFEPLFTTKQQGVGLGLVSCKNIIEQHKGTISVKNNPTTFSIRLPKMHVT